MPGPKRSRRERTEEWASIKQWTLWPEQELYEAIRPLVLFHETAGERAKEIDIPQRTLSRKADEFEKLGMQSLFSSEEHGGARESSLTLPEEIRQLIVDLHFELPSMSWRARTGGTVQRQCCAECWDVPTPTRCSPACCMQPNSPVISTGMGMSGSRIGASSAKMAQAGRRGLGLDVCA